MSKLCTGYPSRELGFLAHRHTNEVMGAGGHHALARLTSEVMVHGMLLMIICCTLEEVCFLRKYEISVELATAYGFNLEC